MISKIQILRGDYDVEMTSSQIPSGNARSYREYSMYDRLRFENKDRQVLLLFSVSGIVQNNDFGFSAFVTMVSSKGPRIYDGQKWLDVKNNEAANTGVHVPVPPTNHGNGAIFINIASYRGTHSRLEFNILCLKAKKKHWQLPSVPIMINIFSPDCPIF